MNNNTPELAHIQLKSLDLPPVFDQIWTFQTPQRFCRQWTLPKMFFLKYSDIAALCPRAAKSVPLLESNLDEALLYDQTNAEYIHYDYGDEAVDLIGSSYQQLISYIFVDLCDAGLFDLVEEVSGDFGYRHLAELSIFLKETYASSPVDQKAKFLRSISD